MFFTLIVTHANSALCATHIGSLAANLARNVPLETAIPRAIVCASLSVTKKGAQSSYPVLADLRVLEERVWDEDDEVETSSGVSATVDGDTTVQRVFSPPALSADEVVDKELIRNTLGI